MSVRDIVVTLIVVGSLPFCLTRPWIGILMWSWIGYMNPHRLTWSFAYTMPFAMMVAVATLTGLLFTRERKPLPKTIETYLLLALWVLFVISTLGAYNPTGAWDQLDKVSKILLVTFITMLLFQDAYKLKLLLYVMALSIGFYGLKGGIWAIVTGGGNSVLGPPDSFIAGNTEIGLAINMVIPLLVLLIRFEERRWVKMGLRATLFFSIPAVLFTYSRGAVVGLGVVLTLMFVKSKAKFVIIPLAIVVRALRQVDGARALARADGHHPDLRAGPLGQHAPELLVRGVCAGRGQSLRRSGVSALLARRVPSLLPRREAERRPGRA